MMEYMVNHPRILCAVCAVLFWLLALAGGWGRRRFHLKDDEDKSSLSLVVSAALTLLGLIISFTFSMASTRYDQRKLYEEGEANAIGTEYVRVDLLPGSQAQHARQLLLAYLDERIAFYNADYGHVTVIDRKAQAQQAALWQSVLPLAETQPNPVTALVVNGMNDVLNSQGYTQFSWWNRIPTTAWWFLVIIALLSNLLVGYATKPSRSGHLLLLVLPVLVSVSFFLISDIDSPRGGVIRIQPKDLMSLSESLHGKP